MAQKRNKADNYQKHKNLRNSNSWKYYLLFESRPFKGKGENGAKNSALVESFNFRNFIHALEDDWPNLKRSTNHCTLYIIYISILFVYPTNDHKLVGIILEELKKVCRRAFYKLITKQLRRIPVNVKELLSFRKILNLSYSHKMK